MNRKLLVAILLALTFVTSAYALKGDVTGDAQIDGKDALKIIMVIEGRVAKPSDTDSFWDNADVYPVPGEGDRLIGDGKVTIEDAYRILKSTVGLVSMGEITGDFSGSPPSILGVDPAHGSGGDHVLISGKNFIIGNPQENIVLFGDVIAKVIASTGDTLTVEVPTDAKSGLIRVVTPGGQAVSPVEFSVTHLLQGKLEPPTGYQPSDYEIINYFGDEIRPRDDGTFDIPGDADAVATNIAIPLDGSDRILMSLHVPGGNSGTPKMNLMTTAQCIVFLTPFFGNLDPDRAKEELPYILNNTQVAALAQLLEQLYAETAYPFDDPRFADAFKTAIRSVIDSMPEGMVVDLSALVGSGGSSDRQRSEQATESTVKIIRLSAESKDNFQFSAFYPDNILTHAEQTGKSGDIKPTSIAGNPVDWMVDMVKVKNIYDTFPSGTQNIVAMDPMTVLPRDSYEQIGFIPSNSYLKYIDLFGVLFNYLWEAGTKVVTEIFPGLKGAASPDTDLHFDPQEETVYIARVFSGSPVNGINPGELAFLWDHLENGPRDFWIALGINLAMAAVDFSSIFIDVKTIAGASNKGVFRKTLKVAVRKGIRLATKKIPKGATGLTSGELAKVLLSVVYGIAQDISAVVAADLVEVGLESRTKMILKIIGKSIDPLYKISVGSQSIERVVSLLGVNRNVTPLETWVLVVGDPFRPRADEINPEDPSPGQIVTLKGANFDYRNKINNEVRIGNAWYTAKQVEVISVSGDGKILSVKIPDDMSSGSASLFVKTGYSPGAVNVGNINIKRIPKISSLTPDKGFGSVDKDAAGPFAGYKGTKVTISGMGLKPSYGAPNDKLFFGNEIITPISTNVTKIEFYVPEVGSGVYPVYIDSPEHGVKTQQLDFTVLSKPSLMGLTPAEAQAGEYLQLTGSSFGENPDEVNCIIKNVGARTLSLDGDLLAIQMPSVGEENEMLNVVVWTPAGPSNALKIKRKAGVKIPDIPDLPNGASIKVTDKEAGLKANRQVSIDEALAFARGDENPFQPPWDDRDIIVTTHYHETKKCETDNQGNLNCWYEWKEGTTTTEYGDSHVGGEQRRYYRVNHDRNGNVSSPIFVKSESLDYGDDNMEEGDYVPTEYVGANYRDYIYTSTPGVYYSDNLTLGNSDKLSLSDNSTLIAKKVVLNDKSELDLAESELQGSGVVIKGNQAGVRIDNIKEIPGVGVLIDGGFGNSLGIKTIDGAIDQGVYIKSGGLNTVMVDNITNCNGDGIFLEGTEGNTITDYFENRMNIENSTGYGVRLENAFKNRLTVLNIKGSSKSGIFINGKGNNTIETLVTNSKSHGIELANTKLNQITGGVMDNQGDGVHLNNGSQYNTITMGSLYSSYFGQCVRNENAILMEGAETAYNKVTGLIGISKDKEGNYVYPGNRKHGIYIRNSAHDNTIDQYGVYGSGSHGVNVEGESTDKNTFSAGYDLAFNKGAGIRIAGGKGNVIRSGFAYSNTGNGITVTGSTTIGTIIEDEFYSGDPDPDDAKEKPNGGAGIMVTNRAQDTHISNVGTGINSDGGIQLHTAHGDTIVEKSSIGYDWSDDTPIEKGLTGNGVLLDRCQDVTLTRNRYYGHEIGIYITGYEGGQYKSMNNVIKGYELQPGYYYKDTISKTQKEGIFILFSEGDQILGTSVMAAGSNGIRLSNTQKTRIDKIYVEKCGEDGLRIESSSGIFAGDSMSRYNARNGVYISGSSDITLFNQFASDNEANGLLIGDQSKSIRVSDSGFSQNAGSGAAISNTDGLTFSSGSFGNNVGHGVYLENCQNVVVSGKDNDSGSIWNNGNGGVYITGDQTKNLTVINNNIGGNLEYGVAVDGGTDVFIGGWITGERNYITKNPIGVLVKGPKTKVAIIGNTIGSYGKYDDESYGGNGVGIKLENEISESWILNNKIQGNTRGIHASDGAFSNRIEENKIQHNIEEGILLDSGAHGNRIAQNSIYNNSVGVRVDGTTTVENEITENSITGNDGFGIELVNGGNREPEAPVITSVTWRGYSITGTVDGAPKGSTVEVYADPDDEGSILLGTSDLYGNNFYVNANVRPGMNFHAIVIHPNGDTSEFGPVNLELFIPMITFTSTRDANQEIYLMKPGSHSDIRLTNNPANDYSPHLAPSLKEIVFVSDRVNDPNIWAMKDDGTRLVMVSQDAAADYDPALNPQGNKLAFVSERLGNPEIFITDYVSGTGAGEIAFDDGTASETAQPENKDDIIGNHFSSQPGILKQVKFFIRENPAPFKWVVLNWSNGQPGTNVIAQGDGSPSETGWYSVDVNQQVPSEYFVGIQYLNDEAKPGLGISSVNGGMYYRYNSSTKQWQETGFWETAMVRSVVALNPTRITDAPGADRYPAWSPDGTKIAFASDRAGDMDIWVMTVGDPNSLRRVTSMPGSQEVHPTWSPDGSEIAFVSNSSGNAAIWVVNADGSNPQKITNAQEPESDPCWLEKGQLIFSSMREGGWEIYLMPKGSSLARRLTSSLGDNIQPNGR